MQSKHRRSRQGFHVLQPDHHDTRPPARDSVSKKAYECIAASLRSTRRGAPTAFALTCSCVVRCFQPKPDLYSFLMRNLCRRQDDVKGADAMLNARGDHWHRLLAAGF